MEEQTQQRRLGRGLSALLGGQGPAGAIADSSQENGGELLPPTADTGSGETRLALVEKVEPSPFQPRREFDAEELNELVGSIREHGVLAPILVRELGDGFQLIAGERRLRACKKAGVPQIPVRVVDVVDQTAFEYALEENLKRTDLNDVEKARAFKRYLDQFQTTKEELAKQLSMSRPALSNLLRLLDLPESVQQAVEKRQISGGHAKAILSLNNEADMVAACGAIQADGLSVRKTEKEVRRLKDAGTDAAGEVGDAPDVIPMTPNSRPEHATAHVQDIESQLRERFGVNIQIQLSGKEKGRVSIPFADNAEFERVLGLLNGGQHSEGSVEQQHGGSDHNQPHAA